MECSQIPQQSWKGSSQRGTLGRGGIKVRLAGQRGAGLDFTSWLELTSQQGSKLHGLAHSACSQLPQRQDQECPLGFPARHCNAPFVQSTRCVPWNSS